MPGRSPRLPLWLAAFPNRHMFALWGIVAFTLVVMLLLPAGRQLEQTTEAYNQQAAETNAAIAHLNDAQAPQAKPTDPGFSEPVTPNKKLNPLPNVPLMPEIYRDTRHSNHYDELDFSDTVTVRPGDTLSGLLAKLGLGAKWTQILLQDSAGHRLKRLMPGDRLAFKKDGNRLQHLRLYLSLTEYLDFKLQGEHHFASAHIVEKTQKIKRYSEGVIINSLFYDAQKAGLSEKLILTFADLFAWDIDFALDLREGDRFQLLYEEIYFQGKKIGDGDILVAEFTNKGKKYDALRYRDGKGVLDYYTSEGRSVRRAFIRSPVDFARVSSRFNLKRRHPVLHSIRAHKGVDYAAARGTPVKATGNGKVSYIGNKGGYGKVIILRHGENYTTLYAHLSRYHKKLKLGSKVQQGDIIGYVGSTGLASGPHLHYEFRVAGVHQDPLRVKLPQAKPIVKQEKPAFIAHARALLEQLKRQDKAVQIATNE